MPLKQSGSKKAFESNVKTEMNANPGKDKMKSNLAIAYAVQKKNKKKSKGGLVRAGSERPTADMDQYAEGGLVRAGSEMPTADSGQEHVCGTMCSDNAHYDKGGNVVRAGSERPTADSYQKGQSMVSPTMGGSTVRAGSQRPTADMYEKDNAPKRTPSPVMAPTRAGSKRPTADNDEYGQTEMLAYGGDVEGEDTARHMGSLAEAIADRLHRKMMAMGGEAHDDGLNENSEEKGNYEDDLSYEALGKEQYDDDQLSDQPEDSNEIGDDYDERDESDKDDGSIISKIRSRSKKKI